MDCAKEATMLTEREKGYEMVTSKAEITAMAMSRLGDDHTKKRECELESFARRGHEAARSKLLWSGARRAWHEEFPKCEGGGRCGTADVAAEGCG